MEPLFSRPAESPEPPYVAYVETPVFRYALRVSTCPRSASLQMRIVPSAGEAVAPLPTLSDGRPAGGYLFFEFDDLPENVRYDGALLHGETETPLFSRAELYRLAVGDESYQVAPQPAQ